MNTQEYSELLETLEPYAQKRLRVKHSLSPSDRDDVLQLAMIDLVRAMEKTPTEAPAALLNTILDRRAIDRVRYNQRRSQRESVLPNPTNPDDALSRMGAIIALPALDNDAQLFVTAFNEAVRNLRPELAAPFILMELRGLTAAEAALELGLPRSTVIFRADAARKQLRKEVS